MFNVKVFVYGTLKPGEINYQYYCDGKVQSLCRAYTWGNLYSLPVGYPAMTSGDNQAWGMLLTFANLNILDSLDKLENYQETRASELNEYYRILVPVFSCTDELLGEAWCYLMTIARVKKYNGKAISSGWWTKSIKTIEEL